MPCGFDYQRPGLVSIYVKIPSLSYSFALGTRSMQPAWPEISFGKTRNRSTVTNMSISPRRKSSRIEGGRSY